MRSYDIDFEDAMEKWQHKLYEVSTRNLLHITVKVHEEEFESYQYDRLDLVDAFIGWMQHNP